MAKKQKQKLKAVKPLNDKVFQNLVFAWNAPEFLRYERGKLWYLIAGLIDLALIAYAIWSGSWSMAMVFIVLPFIFLIEHIKKPKTVTVLVSEWGIRFGNIELAFSDIKGFWINRHRPYVDELRLKTNRTMNPELIIPLMDQNPIQVRQYLVTQIPEFEGMHMSLFELITRFLRLH